MPERPIPYSPTWANLQLGVFVLPLVATDPSADTANIPPDGTTVLWVSGSNLVLSSYTRETGWKSETLT